MLMNSHKPHKRRELNLDELLKDKKYTVKLGDKEYELSPVNWNVLAQIEREFECPITGLKPLLDKTPHDTTLRLAKIFLKGIDPGEISDHESMTAVDQAIAEILGDYFS
jgi:hypothetical protein